MLPVMQSYDIELVATYPTGLDICMQFCIFFLYSATKIDVFFPKSVNFGRVIQKYTKFGNFTGLYFSHFTTFRNETLEFY